MRQYIPQKMGLTKYLFYTGKGGVGKQQRPVPRQLLWHKKAIKSCWLVPIRLQTCRMFFKPF